MLGRSRRFSDSAEELEVFKFVVDGALDQIVIADNERKIIYANSAAAGNTGYSRRALVGKDISAVGLWGSQTDEGLYSLVWDTIKSKKEIFSGEARNRRKDGTIYDVVMSVSPFAGSDGEPKFFVGVEHDITAEKESRRRRDEFKLFFDLSVDIFCVVDANGVFQRVNPAFERALGWSEEDLIGELLVQFVYFDDREATLKELDRLRTGKITTHFKSRFHLKDGGYSWIGWSATPMPDGSFYASLRDITREQRIDQAKTEFVSLASHQLRTPLTSIKWYTNLLLGGDGGEINEKQKKYLEEIQAGNERMIELVTALLDTSRIDMGTFKFDITKVDPILLAKEAIEEQKQKIDEKKLKLSLELSNDTPVIETDKKMLHMIYQNLLSNAVKYTPEGGRIGISVDKLRAGSEFGGSAIEAEAIGIEVSDTGYGIAANEQKEVFQKLFRASSAKKSGEGGTGLGLYIVKSFIELMGGKIWFTSKENKGTKFYVILPMKTPKQEIVG